MRPVIGITASIDHRLPAFGETYSLTRKYAEGVLQAGGVPVIVPHNLDEDALRVVLDRLNGVVLSGGGDIDPALFSEDAHSATGQIESDRDRVELMLARWVVERDIPFLGICRGIQVLNVALGGTLLQDIPSQVPKALPHSFDRRMTPRDYLAHPVKIDPDSQLARVMQRSSADEFVASSINQASCGSFAGDGSCAGRRNRSGGGSRAALRHRRAMESRVVV
jgi:putative glutamine amidotransferase